MIQSSWAKKAMPIHVSGQQGIPYVMARAGLAVALLFNRPILVPLLLAVFLAFQPAHAQPVSPEACDGVNLIAEWQKSDPGLLAEVEAEAAAVINGEGLFWRIEADGVAPSWLFGTMHVTDPRVLSLDPAVEDALDEASVLVVEAKEVLDPVKAQSAMLARPELTMFTDGSTLETLLAPDHYALLKERLAERGIPIALVARMQPWIIASFMALPACELARKGAGAAVLDEQLARRVHADGRPVDGLETMAEQLTAMAELPRQFHLDGLVEAMMLGTLMDDVMATMADLYLAGEIAMILPMMKRVSMQGAEITGSDNSAENFGAFEERVILQRNHVMAERALPFIESGNAFIAVGALHLPGENGLVALLRDSGFRVTRIH